LRKPSSVLVSRLPISRARVNLGQLARRAHVEGEYFILEKGGIPVIGIMDADELEDYLELRNKKVNRQIEQSNTDLRAGRIRPASALLAASRSKPQRPKPQRPKPGARRPAR